MPQGFSISALAKNVGVTSKTLRHWERLGLLPTATRTHTGYRVFGVEAVHYVEFILKAKSVGLTLSEMRRVLDLAHNGKNPCPDVVKWIDEKTEVVGQQIRLLRSLQRRLRHFRRICSTSSVMTCCRKDELCCLIEDLPIPKVTRGANHAEAIFNRAGSAGRVGR